MSIDLSSLEKALEEFDRLDDEINLLENEVKECERNYGSADNYKLVAKLSSLMEKHVNIYRTDTVIIAEEVADRIDTYYDKFKKIAQTIWSN